MAYPSVFDPDQNALVLRRISQLKTSSKPEWGKMDVAQMLAHLNVSYDIAYGHTPTNYGWFTKLMLKLFVKNTVVGEKEYKKNSRTADEFLIADERDFEKEKAKLIEYILHTEECGVGFFEGFESASFGKLSSHEWSNLFSKHLDHHLTQFGV